MKRQQSSEPDSDMTYRCGNYQTDNKNKSSKFVGHSKTSAQKEIYNIKCNILEKKKDLIFPLGKLGKEEQIKTNASRRKEIIILKIQHESTKLRGEKNNTEKSMKPKTGLLERSIQINLLSGLQIKKREDKFMCCHLTAF